MEPLTQVFEERLQEIEAYLDLLAAIEKAVQNGPPKIGESTITSQQQKILYASVYLQLYNLVEATITWCVEAVTTAVTENGGRLAGTLSEKLRREWVRAVARTHVELTPDHRLDSAVDLCEHLIRTLPILVWAVEKGHRGNWDDAAIEAITVRLGCELQIDPAVYSDIKRKIREDKAPLVLVRDLRNRLAHGSVSFSECGEGLTLFDLNEIKAKTERYLRGVVASFGKYIDACEYLGPEHRPAAGGHA